ncbi:hypothetical protein RV18_GL002974 [Enterococcus termitis]|nr:hypothetical protein RV18_GL002974 [Enterococcus termitis]
MKYKMSSVEYRNEISLFFCSMFALVMWGILDPIKLKENK